ncbi:MAG: tail protein X [Fusobacteriaceae bacterium]
MEDRKYVTVLGDTFDLVAWKMYGNSRAIKKIIASNSKYSGTYIFDAGIELLIPAEEEVAKNENIAPWRR